MLLEELNATPLGPREHWPESLRAAYTLCFDTPLPACLVWGPERIQLPNARYRSIHASDDASRPGRDFAVAWHELWPTIQAPFERARAGEGSCLDLSRSPDARSTLRLSLTPVRNEAGRAAGVLLIAIDAIADNDVQRLNADLETLHYLVAHDLHSPLRTLQEIARIVSNDSPTQFPEEIRPFVRHLEQGVTKLAAKADAIVRFASMIQRPLVPGRVDIGALVSAIADELTARAGDRSVSVSIHTLPAARGDAALLRELFTHVLSNAFKFTCQTAETRIEIGGEREGRRVMYHVRDNGVGFDMRHADRLFKPFQRLHSETQFEGIGIGLALASRIVSRHGGAIHVEAAPRAGALFRFTLPADDPHETDL